ncbi:DNA polymerase II large subunit [Methanomicrobium sp. W14]|uniref:DNA-directed DNA polymerase II large subunit n=1 Tax=Methanomicrobium sp. W14 TaxID=2817839 RepID=UPI001AE5659E|nr:DNA-directed DNA polymerase II large subunit [Methanomicrobium sp. W14]MBP2133690.1 DNA polymerase II large subunit [Methanomicrobium sp. W14]
MQASPDMEKYFKSIEDALYNAIDIAKKARKEGYDPRTDVEIPIASDLADRVEALMGYKGVAQRLRELGEIMSREEVSLKIGDDFVAKKFGEETKEDILDHAIRASMALLTEGVVAAPTEGIGKIGIGKNDDGTEYLKIYYAGPIRSAGGTAQALSVLVGDYVRKKLGMNRYIPREEEIERYVEEIKKYNSILSLQYMPSDDELRHIIKNCPVCIDGEPTEKVEVSGYRNLERVETNVVRGGMALVVAEGLGLKAPKIQKIVRKVHMEGWEWLDVLVSGATKPPSDEDEEHEEGGPKIKPKDKYIRDLIGGRPVFSYPMRKGGFRLRYGRSRNTGFAAAGFNPATLHLLGDFLAVGTQMKVERPGKAAGVVPVDTIEGPTVRLSNGDLVRVDRIEDALSLMHSRSVSKIIDVGEILVSFGEFLENNHVLVPSSYCHEWWTMESDGKKRPSGEKEAIEIAKAGYFLHPDYMYMWDDITCDKIRSLSEFVEKNGKLQDEILTLPADPVQKGVLEELLVLHRVRDGKILIDRPYVFLACLGLSENLESISSRDDVSCENPMDMVMHLSGFKMRSKAGTRIGGRMGRPGKSKERKMSPPPNGLFPVGDEGGSRRSFQEASKSKENRRGGIIQTDIGLRRCEVCGKETFRNRCECGGHTKAVFICPRCGRETKNGMCPVCKVEGVCLQNIKIDVKEEYNRALSHLGIRDSEIKLCKGVKGLMSKERCVEPLEKGVLRAEKDLYVFKDGTVRYDMIDLPLTHFRPEEIGISWQRLVELGYPRDVYKKPLESDGQVLELKCQDILVSEDCGDWLLKVANFLDDMLVKIYGIEPYYKAERKEDLVGQLLIGLAPHTSAGVLVRLIGFSKAHVGYGHPYFHAAKRRNCFVGETEISVYDGQWRTLPIRDFVVENFDLSRPELDRVGTYYSDPMRTFWTHSIDSYGAIRMRRITSVSIHRAPKSLIMFKTGRGKSVTVTFDHAMLVCDMAYQRKIKAVELNVGDYVPVFENGVMITDIVKEKIILESAEDYVYCLTVDADHTLSANGIFTGQCDGDEDCVMLLLDGLINFSKAFLPETRGGSMDAPLVLTKRIDPAEVDGECHNVDACDHYPLKMYLAALEYTHPKDIEKEVDHVDLRLGTPAQYEGIMFTHDTSDISAGPLISSYNTLTTMIEKLEAELELGKIIRAVDESDVAERVLKTHFIRDIMGNLNSFSKQTVRCTRCNSKYRRMPIAGKCTKCGNKLIATVHEGSVKKYLDMSIKMCEEYDVSEYTRQRVEVLRMAILSTFGEPPEKQLGLADFM